MIDLEFVEGLIRAVDESSLDSIEIERGGTRIRVSKTPSGSTVANVPQGPTIPGPQGAAQAPAPQVAPAGGGSAGQAEGAESPEAQERAAAEEEGLVDVPSPMVGTFYRAPSPESDPYVKEGDAVSVGDTLCIIEAMKLMNELESEVSGTIVEILVDDAEPVEYGQVLFQVRPS